jgi:predicted O-methyltransferase YrrM
MGSFWLNVKTVMKHPSFLIQYLRRHSLLSNLLGMPSNLIKEVTNESNTFTKTMYELLANYPNLGHMDKRKNEVLYAIVRLLKPNVVIETGVAAGISSAYILKALDLNKKGKLISIDIGKKEFNGIVLPSDMPVGWLVPKALRERWTLKIGSSKQLLQPLLEKEEVDLFLHDSEHSYENMMFEFEAAWKRLSTGGILLSDNIDFNKSFEVFCHSKNARFIKLYGLGVSQK